MDSSEASATSNLVLYFNSVCYKESVKKLFIICVKILNNNNYLKVLNFTLFLIFSGNYVPCEKF